MRSLYGSADEDRDTLHFKDGGGRFERYSSPDCQGWRGMSVASRWFHDITARTCAPIPRRPRSKARSGALPATESVGLLAGGVSHEFNNLLAVILGNTELALLQVPPEDRFTTTFWKSRRPPSAPRRSPSSCWPLRAGNPSSPGCSS